MNQLRIMHNNNDVIPILEEAASVARKLGRTSKAYKSKDEPLINPTSAMYNKGFHLFIK